MPTALVWTPEEDEELQRLVDVHGSKKWALISSKLRTKSSKQCRRRWKNFLSINAKTCSWSADEDAQLMAAHAELGNQWTKISRIFGDRTDNAVKNRWHALVRKHPRLNEQGSPVAAEPKRARRGPSGRGEGEAHRDHHQQQPGFTLAGVRAGAVLPSPFEQNSLGPGMQAQHGPGLGATVSSHLGLGPANMAPGHGAASPTPLAIRVSRELLTPWEVQLAQQVNAMAAPIYIEMLGGEAGGAAAPPAHYKLPELASDPLAARTSWRQMVEGGGLEPTPPDVSGVADIVSWLSNTLGPAPGGGELAPPEGRRMTRSQSREVAPGTGRGDSSPTAALTEEHRSLLRRLMSRGLEARGSWDVGRLLSLDLEPMAGAGAAGGARGADGHPQQQQQASFNFPANAAGTPAPKGRRDWDSLGPGASNPDHARSPRADPMLRTRGSWRRGATGSLGATPELTPTASFDFFHGAAGQQLANRLRGGPGQSGAQLGAGQGPEVGVHLNPTFSSAELQLLVDALLPRPSMAR